MAIIPSLGTAYSGISAFQQGLTVVSDNIANSDTTAYKTNDILFSEMISQFTQCGGTRYQTGRGVRVDTVRAPFIQGTLEHTKNNLDFAIEGAGFFKLKSPDDSPIDFFSRAGAFHVNKEGFIVNPDGLELQGALVATDPLTGKPLLGGGDTVGSLDLSAVFSAPLPTASVNYSRLNLPAEATDPFTATKSATLPTDFDGIVEGDFSINGIDMGFIEGADPTDPDAPNLVVDNLIAAINDEDNQQARVALTGVRASKFPDGSLKLTNVNGGPIVIAFLDNTIAAKTGLQAGEAAKPNGGNTLQGTVTPSDIGAVGELFSVRGEGTHFKTELKAGDTIVIGDRGYTVKSIQSDTELMVTEPIDVALQDTTVNASVHSALSGFPVTVFDSLGSAHTVTVNFTKLPSIQDREIVVDADGNETEVITATRAQWKWSAVVDRRDNNNGDFNEVQGGGIMTFTSLGELDVNNLPTSDIVEGFNFKASPTILALPEQNQQIVFNFEGIKFDGSDATTQFNGEGPTPSASLERQVQDGHSYGALMDNSLSVDGNGYIFGMFTNGTSRALAQVLLSIFPDESGLVRVGGNAYIQSSQSGEPVTDMAGTGGRGKITGNALEESNVDLTKEFVKLITYQRGFQANAKVITTSDEVIQEIVNLKR